MQKKYLWVEKREYKGIELALFIRYPLKQKKLRLLLIFYGRPGQQTHLKI